MQVVITDSAFVTIIAMAMETYKKECIGILYGRASENGFTIEYAMPHQTARRSLSEVNTFDKRLRAARRVVSDMSTLQQIGDYHSHTDYDKDGTWTVPSETDAKSMHPGNIYIVVAIEDEPSREDWHQQALGTIEGRANGKHIRVGAYYVKKGSGPILASLWVAPGVVLPKGIGPFDQMAN